MQAMRFLQELESFIEILMVSGLLGFSGWGRKPVHVVSQIVFLLTSFCSLFRFYIPPSKTNKTNTIMDVDWIIMDPLWLLRHQRIVSSWRRFAAWAAKEGGRQVARVLNKRRRAVQGLLLKFAALGGQLSEAPNLLGSKRQFEAKMMAWRCQLREMAEHKASH